MVLLARCRCRRCHTAAQSRELSAMVLLVMVKVPEFAHSAVAAVAVELPVMVLCIVRCHSSPRRAIGALSDCVRVTVLR